MLEKSHGYGEQSKKSHQNMSVLKIAVVEFHYLLVVLNVETFFCSAKAIM